MARSWPGVSDNAAFCASMERGELNKSWQTDIPIVKIDQEKRLVTGWASVTKDANGNYITDYDGDIIPTEELEKAAHEAFAEAGGKGRAGDMHEVTGAADIVESFVATAEKRKALGFGEGPEGWVVTLKINSEKLWQEIKSGEKSELSIKGMATAMPYGAI